MLQCTILEVEIFGGIRHPADELSPELCGPPPDGGFLFRDFPGRGGGSAAFGATSAATDSTSAAIAGFSNESSAVRISRNSASIPVGAAALAVFSIWSS